MNERIIGALAIVLSVFAATSAGVGAATPRLQQARGRARGVETHAYGPRIPAPPRAPASTRTFSVYRGPVPLRQLLEAEEWWNRSDAAIELTVAANSTNADVVITPYRPLEGDVVGETEVPCDVPCRPAADETITLSPRTDYNHLLTVVHELGHAMGLAHSHTNVCSVMAPVAGINCPKRALPRDIPDIDRRALLAVWGRAPLSTGPSVAAHRHNHDGGRLYTASPWPQRV